MKIKEDAGKETGVEINKGREGPVSWFHFLHPAVREPTYTNEHRRLKSVYYLCCSRNVRMDRTNGRSKKKLLGWRREVEDSSDFGFSVEKGGVGERHDSIQPLPLPDPLISSPNRERE